MNTFFLINSVFMIFFLVFTFVMFYYLKMMESMYEMYTYKSIMVKNNKN